MDDRPDWLARYYIDFLGYVWHGPLRGREVYGRLKGVRAYRGPGHDEVCFASDWEWHLQIPEAAEAEEVSDERASWAIRELRKEELKRGEWSKPSSRRP